MKPHHRKKFGIAVGIAALVALGFYLQHRKLAPPPRPVGTGIQYQLADLVEQYENQIKDFTVKYDYWAVNSRTQYLNSLTTPTFKYEVRGMNDPDGYCQWIYSDGFVVAGSPSKASHTIAYDGRKGYIVFDPGYYLIVDKDEFNDHARSEFFHKSTIFMFDLGNRLSYILSDPTTQVINDQSPTTITVRVFNPGHPEYYFPEYDISFDISDGLKITKITGTINQSLRDIDTVRLLEQEEVLPGLWMPTSVEMIRKPRGSGLYVRMEASELSVNDDQEPEDFEPPVPPGVKPIRRSIIERLMP